MNHVIISSAERRLEWLGCTASSRDYFSNALEIFAGEFLVTNILSYDLAIFCSGNESSEVQLCKVSLVVIALVNTFLLSVKAIEFVPLSIEEGR